MISLMKIKVKNPGMEKNSGNRRSKKKVPKKITETYLHNSGLYYLERYASSVENFKRVMRNKIKKSCAHHDDQNMDECLTLLQSITDKFIDLGLLNDDQYARGMVTSYRRQGKSRKAIEMKLRSKGLRSELVLEHLETIDAEHKYPVEAEFIAALKLAKKRRIGPFQGDKEVVFDKALGIFARAGFNYDMARKVMELSQEDAEDTLYEFRSF